MQSISNAAIFQPNRHLFEKSRLGDGSLCRVGYGSDVYLRLLSGELQTDDPGHDECGGRDSQRRAASKFTRSVAEGNHKYAKELFTEDACLFGFLNGKFERGSIEQFYRNVDTVGAGENFKTRIDVLELEETLAVVRVLEEGWGGKIDFTDVLLLLKIDGEWKCVAKAYNQNSNTIEK